MRENDRKKSLQAPGFTVCSQDLLAAVILSRSLLDWTHRLRETTVEKMSWSISLIQPGLSRTCSKQISTCALNCWWFTETSCLPQKRQGLTPTWPTVSGNCLVCKLLLDGESSHKLPAVHVWMKEQRENNSDLGSNCFILHATGAIHFGSSHKHQRNVPPHPWRVTPQLRGTQHVLSTQWHFPSIIHNIVYTWSYTPSSDTQDIMGTQCYLSHWKMLEAQGSLRTCYIWEPKRGFTKTNMEPEATRTTFLTSLIELLAGARLKMIVTLGHFCAWQIDVSSLKMTASRVGVQGALWIRVQGLHPEREIYIFIVKTVLVHRLEY